MHRLSVLLATFVALAPALAAQPAADSALVARIYDDLARGDVSAVAAVLDDHVLWIEGAHSPQVGRHFGPGTVAAFVLLPLLQDGVTDVPDSVWVEGDQVVAAGTTRRSDPATGRVTVARFRHVWRVLYGRVVSVERSAGQPLDAQATKHDGPDF